MISKAFRHIFKREPIYYGWIIALALAVTETVSYGVMFYAFSVFITPMEAELGWSRAQLTGAFSLSLLITGLVGVPVGWWLDKHGGRLLMTVGSIGAMLLVALWSQVQTLPEFVLIMTLLGFCGAAVLYEPAFAIIATWFARRRGTAMAVLTFVAGFSSTIFIPLSDALLVAQGWRGAVLTLAILLGVITIPLHGFLLRGKPQDLGLQPDGALPSARSVERQKINLRGVLRSRYFWILTLAFALSWSSISAMRVHFIPLLISVGIHPTSAAWASGMIGVMQVLGRMVFVPLERRFSSKNMVLGVCGLLALSLATLLLGSAGWMIAVFVALFGMALGTHTLARPLVVADNYGAAFYGRISSAMVIVLTLMGTIAPVGAGVIFDVFGNYELMLLLALGFSVASLVLIWLLPRRQAH
ncbi:MAG: MFS transporter [Chloroflexi bacterium]|nr:MFS transporter [Chloroflexota bacterium]